jgi:4'-phosphopantetheinyl transferase
MSKPHNCGLIEGLNKVEFSHSNWTNISAAMDGKVMALWRFWLTELGERHCVSSSLTFIWFITYMTTTLKA